MLQPEAECDDDDRGTPATQMYVTGGGVEGT